MFPMVGSFWRRARLAERRNRRKASVVGLDEQMSGFGECERPNPPSETESAPPKNRPAACAQKLSAGSRLSLTFQRMATMYANCAGAATRGLRCACDITATRQTSAASRTCQGAMCGSDFRWVSSNRSHSVLWIIRWDRGRSMNCRSAFRSRGILHLAALLALFTCHYGAAFGQPSSSWDDEREITSLATNIDKAIQACGLQVSERDRERRATQRTIEERGIRFTDTAPEIVKSLTGMLGASRYHKWFDLHAEVWLVASVGQPACRILVSKSAWVSKIGPTLDKLIRVGNFWRPARHDENILQSTLEPGAPSNAMYLMDTPDGVPVRPMLIITTPTEGKVLKGGQQMIITVGSLNKR